MAPAPTDHSFPITTLCIRRLCLGYRSKAIMSSTAASGTTRPDIFSASIVMATAFVVVSLMLMLLLVLLETVRILTLSRSPHGDEKSAENIAHIYNQTIASCPPTFPTGEGTCAVCLDDYCETTIGRKMPCGHFFHVACIDRWILRTAGKRWPTDIPTCPVCKQAVLKEHHEVPIEQAPLIQQPDPQFSDEIDHEMHLAENMA